MRNIIASFRTTGIYLPARDVVLSQIPGKSNDSQPHQSVPFVPFCTPRRFQTPSSEDSALLLGTPQCSSPFSTLQMELPTHNTEVSSLQFGPTFSSAEVRHYRVWLEEGYDLHDNRYIYMHNGYPHYQHFIAIVPLKTMGVPARVDLHQNSYQL